MPRTPPQNAFTLIEMLTVMAVIAILAGLVLSINGLVQRKAASARTATEIKAMEAGCAAYKADNGTVPQDATTDALDPRVEFNPAKYKPASLYLYKALSGDTDANGKNESSDPGKTEGKDYGGFKPDQLGGPRDADGAITKVEYLRDPYGNSYGYSTAAAALELTFRESLRTNPSANRPVGKGYNPSFDLWSTGGSTGGTDTEKAKWVKSW